MVVPTQPGDENSFFEQMRVDVTTSIDVDFDEYLKTAIYGAVQI